MKFIVVILLFFSIFTDTIGSTAPISSYSNQLLKPRDLIKEREKVLRVINQLNDPQSKTTVYWLLSGSLDSWMNLAGYLLKTGRMSKTEYKAYTKRIVKETQIIAKALEKLGSKEWANLVRLQASQRKELTDRDMLP